MDTVGGRIRLLRKRAGDTQASLAGRLKVHKDTILRWENNRTIPEDTDIERIAELYGADPEWLRHGDAVAEAKAPYGPPSKTERSEYAEVPYYYVDASAGGGAVVDEERIKTHLAFRADWLRRELGGAGGLALLSVAGDSMQPTLQRGDTILIDTRVKGAARLRDGIYVLRHGDELVVKRLQFLPGGRVEVRSDNPAYEPYSMSLESAEDTEIVGRVVWSARLH